MYKEKYYKYKIKYDDLLKQSGGNNINLLDSKTTNFIKSTQNDPPIYTLPIEKARHKLNQIQKSESYKNNVKIENIKIHYNNQDIDFSIFKPINNDDILNVVMYFHGGGWILGNVNTHGRLVSDIAVNANVAVVFVNFSHAPEAKYPIQLHQCFAATKYITQNSSKYNMSSDKMILIGDSVGANMAISVSYMASLENIKISSQILLYPATDALMSMPSYKYYENGPWLSKKGMQWFYNAYGVTKNNAKTNTISPLYFSDASLKLLPKTLIITDENDVLRDEGELFAHKLMNVGVSVTAARFLGTIHDFLILDPIKYTPAVIAAKSMIISYITQILNNLI